MKTETNSKKEEGQGHKARIALCAKCKLDMDGKVTEFNIDYDVTVTIEHIDYIVRMVAGSIAQVANEVAQNGITAVTA